MAVAVGKTISNATVHLVKRFYGGLRREHDLVKERKVMMMVVVIGQGLLSVLRVLMTTNSLPNG